MNAKVVPMKCRRDEFFLLALINSCQRFIHLFASRAYSLFLFDNLKVLLHFNPDEIDPDIRRH